VKFGAPRDTDHPKLKQPLALEVWESVVKSLDPGSKVTILTNGPLTYIAKIVLAGKSMTNAIQVSVTSILVIFREIINAGLLIQESILIWLS